MLTAETTEAFLDGHFSAFAFFGGVPQSILYDNTKLAVARICGDGKRERTRAFSGLVSHYLFRDRFGRPGKGNDKGKVEGLAKNGRRRFNRWFWRIFKPLLTPLHYLALIEQKPGALDQARPLQDWALPEQFLQLRRLLEARMGARGKREFIGSRRRSIRTWSPMRSRTPRGSARQPRRRQAADPVPHREAAAPARSYSLSLSAEGRRPRNVRRRLRRRARQGGGMIEATDKPQLLLRHHLKQLKLPIVLAEYEKVARDCARSGVDHVRYLLRLCELELIERERRIWSAAFAPRAFRP